MKTWIIENGSWEVKTSGKANKGSTISFIVHRQIWERIAFKCQVDTEIVHKGAGLEINLIHKKELPEFVKRAIRNIANEFLKENRAALDLAHA